MNIMSLDQASATALCNAAALVGEAVDHLRAITLIDMPAEALVVGDFPLGANAGAHLACEAFMEERDALLEQNARLLEENRQAGAVFNRIATYANALSAAFANIGVRYSPGEDDQPVIEIDPERLGFAMVELLANAG